MRLQDKLLIKQLDGFKEHPPLRYCYDGDVGMDLYYGGLLEAVVEPHGFVDLECGIAVKLPEDVWGMVTARSSTFFKKRLFVYTGIIDNGYTGPLKLGVYNPDDQRKFVQPGEALGQLILMPIIQAVVVDKVVELPETTRGGQGFGSTDTLAHSLRSGFPYTLKRE